MFQVVFQGNTYQEVKCEYAIEGEKQSQLNLQYPRKGNKEINYLKAELI